MRIAVLGCGRIGKMHAENILHHPRCDLTMVFDTHTPSAEAIGVPVASSLEQVFTSDKVDGVFVATATDTHADMIEMAVAYGKPVFCEKPIDQSLERVDLCAERIAGKNAVIQLGFNRRFDPGHKAVHDACVNGDIGELYQVIISSRDPSPPPRTYVEVCGGLLRDMTIHDFDLARFMLGEEPVEIFAMANALVDPATGAELNDFDTAMIQMRTASGKQCHINNCRQASYGYDQRVELHGSKGMVISDNQAPTAVRRFGADGQILDPCLDFFIERYSESFVAEIDAFVDAFENGTPTPVGFEDGRMALVLAEAAYKSIAEKRSVEIAEI